jgi:hypothetical protein
MVQFFTYALIATVSCYAYMLRIISTSNDALLHTLDVSMWSGEQDAFTILDRQGEEGREAYAKLNKVDMIFAVLYGYVLHDLIRSRTNVSKIYLVLPVFAFCGDELENIAIYYMLQSYPDLAGSAPMSCRYGPIMTRLKWAGICCTLIVLIYATAMGMGMEKKITNTNTSISTSTSTSTNNTSTNNTAKKSRKQE